MSRPDAVLIPETIKKGRNQVARLQSVLKIVEPLLGVQRPKEQAHIRRQPNATLFITRDPKDTLFFPFGDDLEGQPRYDWEITTIPGIDGEVQIGRLIDPDASTAEPPHAVDPDASTAEPPAPASQPEPKS